MSDLMLLGALRAPAPEPDNVLGIAQLVDRARQAADEIERLTNEVSYLRTREKNHQNYIAELEADNERLRAAVAQQAEDDGLWFIAETAPEAYLQNALRYLHALIEQDARALAALKGDDDG